MSKILCKYRSRWGRKTVEYYVPNMEWENKFLGFDEF